MRRPGFTVLEVMVAACIFSMIFLGGYTMLNTASTSFDRNTAQTDADVDAVLAMQHIINDLREAKSFVIQNPGPSSGSRLVISYPLRNADGTFDRYVPDPDPDTQVTYYVQNRSLWRLKPSENPDPIRVRWGVNDEFTAGENAADSSTWTNESGVEQLLFTSDSPLSVKITVRTSMRRRIPTLNPQTGQPDRMPQTTELTQRLVYLRNW
jgi:type II secretory pathway component PulJ